MKKHYEAPEMQITLFESEDILMASGVQNDGANDVWPYYDEEEEGIE